MADKLAEPGEKEVAWACRLSITERWACGS